MGKRKIVKAGGFYLEHGIPDEYYAFADGELSVTVERGGGINTIHLLDILECEGKLYPDRSPTPAIIEREGSVCGVRPVYGPGIQFISTNLQSNGRRGRNLFHVPDKTELYPFGFRSSSDRFGHRLEYDLCLDRRSILFRFSNAFPTRNQLVMTLNKDHLVSGEMDCMKRQLLGWPVPEVLKTLAPDPDKPFPDNGKMNLIWDFLGFDAQINGFLLDGRMQFTYGVTPICVLIAANCPMSVTENKCRYFLSFPWNNDEASDEIRLCMILAQSRAEAVERVRAANASTSERIQEKTTQAVGYARKAPRVKVEGMPAASDFVQTLGAFERAMVLAETPREACIRAAMHKFGYFAMWDQIYPVRAFLTLGDYRMAIKLLRYMVTLPQVDPLFWITVQLMIAIDEAAAITGDGQFMDEAYATLKRFFQVAADFADSQTGLIALHCSCGVDDPKEIGIEGLVWTSCINGWWYGACRSMENAAMQRGDTEIEIRAGEVGKKVASSYLDIFLDRDRGYLHAVVDPATRKGTGVYQNVSTLGMDYPYGESLFHPALREIAEYQAYALCHPAGRSAVAYDDVAHEMWKHVIMFQHLAHEAKTARVAGLGEEAFRITENYINIFQRCKVGMETQNLCGAEGDISQRANWQAFGASSGLGALISGVIGIQTDSDGFAYVPCDVTGTMKLQGFYYRQARWDIDITGEGEFVKDFEIDGQSIQGTMQIPLEFIETRGRHQLKIVRTREPFTRPTLLRVSGAGLVQLESSADSLAFAVHRKAHVSIKTFSPAKPQVRCAGQEVSCDWNEATKILWCDMIMAPGDKIIISI